MTQTIEQRRVQPEAWRAQAECRFYSPDLWFPDWGDYAITGGKALRICRSCLVRRDCLIFAFRTGQKHGIWGGLTPKQRTAVRNRLRRKRQLAAAQ